MTPSRNPAEDALLELRKVERRLADLLDSITEYFIALDRDWRFTFVNPQIATFLGKPVNEILGQVMWDLFPEARGTAYYPNYLRVMNEHVPVSFEVWYESLHKWYEVHAHPTEEGLTAYVVDVTARKQAEQAVERSERRFRAMIENASDGIIITDATGAVVFTGRSLMGHAGENWNGRNTFDTLHPDDRKDALDRFTRMARTPGGSLWAEYRTRHSDGSWHWLDISAKNLLDDPDVAGIVVNYRDITERKRLEAQLLQAQKLESLGVLAGGIAHDFNNLLVGIMGNASLALDGIRDADGPAVDAESMRERLEEVLAASEQAANLSRQMLAYSGRGRFIIEPLQLTALVRDMAKLLHTSVPRHVELRLELADNLPAIEADRTQMQQLLMNLVINGGEAIGDGQGTVTVRTGVETLVEPTAFDLHPQAEFPAGRCVVLEVQDTGCGMEETTARKIFDPFFTTKSMGRGLGLAAAQGIVRGHKGGIRIRTAPGQGTTFTVIFPESAAAVPQVVDIPPGRETEAHETVLVVDDEEIVRTLAKAALQHRGYRVLLAENGADAIEVFRRHPEIALVLLDLSMPVMGGEECWRELRAIRPDVRVVLSSGYSEAEAVHRFAGQSLSGFVQKPYTAAKLRESVKAALREV